MDNGHRHRNLAIQEAFRLLWWNLQVHLDNPNLMGKYHKIAS
ncbi:hypothetical protein [Helicobacter suis]|nr:hypothetical protein [Helicobacter suis]